MSSSIFGAEQRISEPLSALAVLTGRHSVKTRATLFLSTVNESTKTTSQRQGVCSINNNNEGMNNNIIHLLIISLFTFVRKFRMKVALSFVPFVVTLMRYGIL